MKMRNRLAPIIAVLLLFCACAAVGLAQSGIRWKTGKLQIESTGAITIQPKSGQGVSIGGGTAIKNIYSGTASLDFGATAAGACDALTITVTGAADGDTVHLGVPAALMSASEYQTIEGYVSAANTVTVKRCNTTNSTTALSNAAAATVRATVFHY
jgi:hypothetical protein